jgi:hypothetical protein
LKHSGANFRMEENRHFYHGYTLIASRMMAGAANAALAEPDASYTTTMRLRDGMQGTYAVNEPAATPVSGAQTQTLTASERNEAEIAATAILRRNAGKECLPTPLRRRRRFCSGDRACDRSALRALLAERHQPDRGGSIRSSAYSVVKGSRGWPSCLRRPCRAAVFGKGISLRAAALSDPAPRRVKFFL